MITRRKNGAYPPEPDFAKGVDLAEAVAAYLHDFTADIRQKMLHDFTRTVQWFVEATDLKRGK